MARSARPTAPARRRAADRPTDHRGRYVPDGSWPPGRGAPEPLERVRRFVNTANPESGADHFETPASWRPGWNGRATAGPRVTERDRTRAVLLRAAVRELAIANHEGGSRPGSTRPRPHRLLDGLAGDLPLVVRCSPAPALVPVSAGVDGGAVEPAGHRPRRHGGRHVVPVEGVPEQPLPLGLLRPLPQQLGAWCSELACGSRMKVRAYRARQRAGRDASPRTPRRRSRTSDEAGRRGRRRSARSVRDARRRRVREQQRGNGSTAPPAPKGTFCEVVLAWSNAGVGTVNHFSRVSPNAADVSARRRLLLPGLGRARRHLHLGRLGGRPGARHGAGRAPHGRRRDPDDGRDRKDAASKLPDRAYEYASVQDGTLFVSNEKTRASSTARSTSCGASSASRWCPGRAVARPSRSRSRSSPRRDGGLGRPVGAASRAGLRPQASTSTRRMARAFTMRIDVRRFHIFIFQWRRRRRLTCPTLALTGSWRWTGR